VRNLESGLELLATFENLSGPAAVNSGISITRVLADGRKVWGIGIDHLVLLATLGGALNEIHSRKGRFVVKRLARAVVSTIQYYSTRIGQALDAMSCAGSGSMDHG
jgi:hypothetical protein